MYKVNGEFFACGITDSDRVPSTEGGIHNLAYLVLLNRLSTFAQNFTVEFLKLFSTHSIHIVVWETSPLILGNKKQCHKSFRSASD